MDLKDFVKNVLIDINAGVDEARETTKRDISFTNVEGKRTVEFDIAVTVEKSESAEGKAGVKVMNFAEGGGTVGKANMNSTVSRICFGVHVDVYTKEESRRHEVQSYNNFD